TGSGLCVLTIDAAKAVTATFTLNPEVNVTPDGEGGTVTVEVISDTVQAGAVQAPVQVGATTESYPIDTVLRLTAVPWLGYAFDGWGGDASGNTNPLEVTVTEGLEVTA